MYKCINSITRHDTIPQNVTLDSKWPPLILKRLISSLLSLYTEFIQLIPPLESLPIPSSTICDITISVSDVYDALTSLNPTKAMGIDGTKELCFSIVSTHLPSICFKPNTALFAQGVKVTSDHTYLQVRK